MAAAARRWLEDASAIGEDVDGRRRCRDPRRCRWRRCRRFTPASPREWALRDGSVGCARRMRLNCTGDGFLPLRGVKLPDATNATADASISLDQCWQRFLMNCSCLAFSASSINRGESGCINEDIAAEGVRRGGEAGGIDQAAAAPAAAAAGATRRRQGARCARCGEICEEYAKTFYLGTLLMMEERRHAIWAIYGQEQAWSQVYAHKGFFVLFELADLQPGVSAQ